jgi:hypothetical protein
MKTLVAICTLMLCQEAAAQMFKCADKAGKITYSSTRCSDIGLRDAGEIRDRLQVTPAPPAARPAAAPTPPPVSGPAVQPEAPKPAAAAEPEKEKRCFTITAAGGKKVTRCNDKPDAE